MRLPWHELSLLEDQVYPCEVWLTCRSASVASIDAKYLSYFLPDKTDGGIETCSTQGMQTAVDAVIAYPWNDLKFGT